jgi:hypothetical protein
MEANLRELLFEGEKLQINDSFRIDITMEEIAPTLEYEDKGSGQLMSLRGVQRRSSLQEDEIALPRGSPFTRQAPQRQCGTS